MRDVVDQGTMIGIHARFVMQYLSWMHAPYELDDIEFDLGMIAAAASNTRIHQSTGWLEGSSDEH
jgi:hypothetical protein